LLGCADSGVRERTEFDGTAIAGRALNARAVRRFGPAAKVELEGLSLGLEAVSTGDGGEGAEEEVAGISHDGGAAGSDLVAGLELIEFAERVVDVGGGEEFLDAADEGGGEIGLVEFFLALSGMSGAEAGARFGDGHAATTAARSAVLTMGQNEGGGDGGARSF